LNLNGPITAPVAFNGGLGNDVLNVNSGSFTFVGDASAGSSNLTVNVAAGANVNFKASQHLAGLSVNGTAGMQSNGNRVLVTKSPSIAGPGAPDPNDNDLVLGYAGASQLGAIQDLINAARNGGTWNGTGLTSTAARNTSAHNTTLGAMESTDYANVH